MNYCELVEFNSSFVWFVETNSGFLGQEELDIRTLQSKNRKLAEMLDQRQAIEDELREHIEKLERRQATDDASLLIVNRYWSQVATLYAHPDSCQCFHP